MALFRRGFFFWVKGPSRALAEGAQGGTSHTLGNGLSSWSENGLDLIRVDETGNV
jgi:hypothetical protein